MKLVKIDQYFITQHGMILMGKHTFFSIVGLVAVPKKGKSSGESLDFSSVGYLVFGQTYVTYI